MRIIFRKIDQVSKTFQVKVGIVRPDDIWHLYQIINRNDMIKAKTARKITKQTETGVTHSQRRVFDIVLKVISVEYLEDADVLRISGTNASHSPFLKIGQHHSLELQLNSKLVIIKQRWDDIHLARIEMARQDKQQNLQMAVLLLQQGIAHLFRVSKSTTQLKFKINKAIPKKKAIPNQHNKAIDKFFESCTKALYTHSKDAQNIIIASPGFTKDNLYKHMQNSLGHQKGIDKFFSKIMRVHCSSGFKYSLSQVLEDSSVNKKLSEAGCQTENAILEKFYKMLETDQDKIAYGLKDIIKCDEGRAIDQLLITDMKLSSGAGGVYKMKNRMGMISLMDSIRKSGGKITIFSSKTPAGQKIDDLGGIAGILRFPMPNLNQDNSDSEDEEDFYKKQEDNYDDEGDQEVKGLGGDQDLDDMFWNNLKLSDGQQDQKWQKQNVHNDKIREVNEDDDDDVDEDEQEDDCYM